MRPACACACVPGRNCRGKRDVIYGLGRDFHFLRVGRRPFRPSPLLLLQQPLLYTLRRCPPPLYATGRRQNFPNPFCPPPLPTRSAGFGSTPFHPHPQPVNFCHPAFFSLRFFFFCNIIFIT